MGSRDITTFDGSKYGTNYSIGTVSQGNTIASSNFTSLVGAVNAEWQRRNQGNPSYGNPSGKIGTTNFQAAATSLYGLSGQAPTANSLGDPGQDVSSTTISQINQNAAFSGYSNSGLFNGVSNPVKASEFNGMVNLVFAAGQQCLCNCNYCTCNCNYCTCNCDYSCTCNCNYSDERLKENIKFINTESDINVYSYTYLWNKTKTFIGVLAQELIGTKYESALGQDSNGYYYVDYSQLPVTFREV